MSVRRKICWHAVTVSLLGTLIFYTSSLAHAAEESKYFDVVIYGGTSAGVTAAIQVRRMGHSVLLIEPTMHLGGMTTCGLSMTDTGDKRVIGGIAREFYQRLKRHYDQESAWRQERPADYALYRPEADAIWTFEPHVAERTIEEMVREAGVTVVRAQRLMRPAGAIKHGARIEEVHMETGEKYRARVFVDASYEGDLMAAAGVRYVIGREANSVYNETLNGVQPQRNTHNHRFVVRVDPFLVPGQPSSGLLPGIEINGPGKTNDGDQKIQAYCFRLCMSNAPDNRVPFPKPDQYDERDYELLFRNFESGDLRVPMHAAMMPNRKTDTNNNGAVSTDFIGANYDYPEATYAARDAIVARHKTYQQGLMWTLANHPRVPPVVREEISSWGLAKDEFTDNAHWPYQIYVREARRMVSDYVITEADCRSARPCDDSIGMGSYNMDSHNVQRYVTSDGRVENEGDVQESPGGPYRIAYRAVVPSANEADNLLVPVCLSASHIAYGSIRMEPVFMILGQSVGTAAVIAIERDCTVQTVPYPLLSGKLKDQRT